MRRVLLWCTGLGRRGGVIGAASGCLHRCASSARGNILFCRNCRRSGMLDLRRFPVSDGAGIKCGTFCTILDRKHFLDFLNYWFWKIGHVTTEYMEMSGIAVRIEWKHFWIPLGPASGRNSPLKSRNLCFGDYGTFFQSLRKFEKWENRKLLLAMWSKLFLSGWKRFGVNRWPGGRAISGKRPGPPRKPRLLNISLAGYPIFDLAIFGL